MEIGKEGEVIVLLTTVEKLTEECGKAILGTITISVNGRTAMTSFDAAEVRDVLLDGYCRQLAANYIVLAASYDIRYTPELEDPDEIKAAMLAKFGVAS